MPLLFVLALTPPLFLRIPPQGTFSRLDFQRNPRASINSVREFTSRLPAAAQDVYYRDVIGNISTSHLRVCLGGGGQHTRVCATRPESPSL